ncbi:MAG: cation diffusion facilitator family transporter [Bacilli bacterium]|nr:cation diffusion facilitator family transporter [Bacilli bacterium]
MDRNKERVRVSIQGIIVNIILVIFKAIVGLIANSIAIILDAVNNLSDALSSIITIIGTKLSEKRPNKKHPYGYGRIEYFSSVIIAIIVLLAGLTSLRESIMKIIKPELADYSIVTIIIIVVAVIVKFVFGRYVKSQGERLNSGSLVASGTDAISDSVLSFSTLIAIIANLIWKISLEGYLGAIISVVIIKSAIEILKDTINDMLGVRTDTEVTNNIKKVISKYKEVLGVYDLTIHNYGPNKIVGSAHIQLDDNLNVRDIHRLTRRIEIDIYSKYGIILTLGIYASNDSKEYKDIKKYINNILKEYKNIIQMHGFYVDEEYKIISFDLIFSFDEDNPEKCAEEINKKLKEKYPEYNFSIILDADVSD